jgi:predicted amidohydrolase
MDAYTATVGQLALSGPERVYRQIQTTMLAHPEAGLFVFPEFATQEGADLDAVSYLREDPEARATAEKWLALVPAFSRVRALAEELGKAVVVGCIAQNGGQLHSRAYFYDPREKQLAFYDKSHVHWTEAWLRPGGALEPVQTRFGALGMLICYDVAFVEPTRVLGLQGAELLCALSAIPMSFHFKYPHYRMTGAAIFNQYYVIAANLGHTLQAPMGGHSGVYSPEGDRIAYLPGTEYGAISAQIDLGLVRLWREQEMIGPYRKPALYRAITDPASSAEA